MTLRTFAVAFSVTTIFIDIALAEDWIIGANDPNEVVILTTDREVDGNVTIINSGRLEVQNAELYLHGDIILTQNASLNVTGGQVRFDQTYSYQRRLLAVDDAAIRFQNAQIDTGGPYAYSVAMLGNSSADFDNVNIVNNGGATWTFWDAASLNMNNCNRAVTNSFSWVVETYPSPIRTGLCSGLPCRMGVWSIRHFPSPEQSPPGR